MDAKSTIASLGTPRLRQFDSAWSEIFSIRQIAAFVALVFGFFMRNVALDASISRV